MAMGLALSLGLLAGVPAGQGRRRASARPIDFDQLLQHGALGFLLFAESRHVDFGHLRQHRTSIGVLAVAGTLTRVELTVRVVREVLGGAAVGLLLGLLGG